MSASNGNAEKADLEDIRALLHQGFFDEALEGLRPHLKDAPDHPIAEKLAGVAYLFSGRADQAIAHFEKCATLQPDNPEAQFDFAAALEAADRLDDAVAILSKAIELDPGYADALNNLGLIQDKIGRRAEAVENLQQAVDLMPGSPIFLSNLATVQRKTDAVEEAERNFEAAIAIDPAFIQSYANFGDLLQFQNRLSDVEELLIKAEAHCDPAAPELLDLRAHLAMDQKNYAEATSLIEQAIAKDASPTLRHRRYGYLGKAYDRAGDHEKAFRSFESSNLQAAENARRRGIDGKRYAGFVNRLIADMESGSVEPIISREGTGQPVFLVGFPRSGTTLLDSILRSHPDIDVLEELPIVTDLRLSRNTGFPAHAIPDLSSADRDALQRAYLHRADESPGRTGAPILIDKFPLNLVEAGFIAAVFPAARFILSLRHPNDCVLSCFMQTFELNPAMANFLNLGDASHLYDRTMTLWDLYERRLALKVHRVRYEDVVADMRGAVAPALDFIGAGWHKNVENYRQTALDRGQINTPSYNQVVQPLYREAMDRWRNYETRFTPYQHLLDPWIEQWGYA